MYTNGHHLLQLLQLDSAIKSHEKYSKVHIELSIDGFIRITQTIRSPIFNSRKEIVAIASVDYDFARQCRLLELFHLYQRYLPQDKSVKQFLKFLDIDHYFREFPTITELMIILSMCENESIPFICDCTKLSPQLVEQNKASLQTKFFNFDLTHLLINLRTRHESNFELCHENRCEPKLS